MMRGNFRRFAPLFAISGIVLAAATPHEASAGDVDANTIGDTYTEPDADCVLTEFPPADENGKKVPPKVLKKQSVRGNGNSEPITMKSDGFKVQFIRDREGREHLSKLTVTNIGAKTGGLVSIPEQKTGCNVAANSKLPIDSSKPKTMTLSDKDKKGKIPPDIVRLCFGTYDVNGDLWAYQFQCSVEHNVRRDAEREKEKQEKAKGPADSSGGKGAGAAKP